MKPFTIEIADDVLEDHRARLARTRWPDDLRDGDRYGPSVPFMRDLVEHWRARYDWRAEEQRLNRWPQFVADVDGVSVHFVHVRGNGRNALPIVLTHGWPGSFVEMLDVAPLLADAFDVVIPSIPGFGFSSHPNRPGMNLPRIADLWAGLMQQLGYDRFVAQGGDFGASVATWLARRHADRLLGIHLNYIPGSYEPHVADPSTITAEEREFLRARDRWFDAEYGYAHIQRTGPQTLAYGISDSPAGLAAWIVDKFQRWSDCGGDVTRRFSMDGLLTNVMIYWVTNSFRSSIQLYDEASRAPVRFGPGERVTVPTAVARFPLEAPFPPRSWVERGYRVERWTEMPSGGHFAAWEEPQLLAEDIYRVIG